MYEEDEVHDDNDEEHDDDGHENMDEFEDDGFLVADENHQDSDDDEEGCCICCDGGSLIVCDGGERLPGCGKNFHIACIDREEVPEGDWICQACAPKDLQTGIRGYEFTASSAVDNNKRKAEVVEVEDSDDEAFGVGAKSQVALKDVPEESSVKQAEKKATAKRLCIVDSDDSD
jgi:hypothetical protein